MVSGGKIRVSVLKEDPAREKHWYLPWLAAFAINIAILLFLAATIGARVDYGSPVPNKTIPIVIIAAEQAAAALPRTPKAPEVPAETPVVVDTEPVREPVQAEIPPPPLPISERQPDLAPELAEAIGAGARSFDLPDIALPEGQGGGPTGVVAIYCPQIFSDPDKAAECAGRDIRSGWQRTNEDWSTIAGSLLRGGVNVPRVPLYGPDWRDPLGPNETYYEAQDLSVILGPKIARAVEDERKGRWLKEGQQGVFQMTNPTTQSASNYGIGTPYYLESWEPTWAQREDPSISLRDLERLKRDYDNGGDSGEE